MEIKLIELRDAGTFMPMLAIKLGPANEKERWLLAQARYGRTAHEQHEYVLFGQLNGGQLNYDPYAWPRLIRTYHEAHRWLIAHWDDVISGSVVDVEFILGETSEPKKSEQLGDNVT